MTVAELLHLVSPGVEASDVALVVAMWRAEQPGLLARVERLAALGPDLARLEGLLAESATTADVQAAVRLAHQARYGNPARRPARDVPSWREVGYTTEPAGGAEWPAITLVAPPTMGFGIVRDAYDVVVVGTGCGAVAAHVAAEAGARVLLVESGTWLGGADLQPDPLRNQRLPSGLDVPAGPPTPGNPRVAWDGAVVGPTDGRWSNNAFTVGGGLRVFGAQAWRFCPEDFRMASTYGVPDGSALADWPIAYEEIAPWYTKVEQTMGVSGSRLGNPYAGTDEPYPMGPLPRNRSGDLLAHAAAKLGWETTSVPLLINSAPFGGRPACVECGACVGFPCRAEAKNGTHNTVLPLALATGRCDLVLGTRAVRIEVEPTGRASSVVLADVATGARRTVRCERLVVAAGAIETARLLLLSANDDEPTGLGNRTDNVGRHLQSHLYPGAVGLTADVVQEGQGPGPTVSVQGFRHGNPGLVGGGMLANDFVPLPGYTVAVLQRAGLLPMLGAGVHEGLSRLYRRHQMAFGPVQEVTTRDSRVTLDPAVTDGLGLPVARLSGSVHAEDLRAADFMCDRAVEWLVAAGARGVTAMPSRPSGPSSGQHQAGTCRMGDDPATSVVDPTGRVWGHENIHVADTSVHVTNGGVNPVLTGLALAWRTADLMVSS